LALEACILLKTVPLQTDDVLKKVRSLHGVHKVFVAYGRYDVVAWVRAEAYPEIRKLTGEINSIQGVRSTETLVEA
jgi:DNA-binding Lrp family transcriptional regulator